MFNDETYIPITRAESYHQDRGRVGIVVQMCVPFFEDLPRFDAHLNMGQQGFKPLTVVSPPKEYVQGHIIQWSRLKASYYTGSLVTLGHFLHQQDYSFKPCFQKSAKNVKR
jgi:hypothetical protein